jgi:hypothetical protein
MLHIGINALHGDAPSILFPRHWFALTNTAAGSAARFSMLYRSITAQLRIHFFKSRPSWL